MLDNPYHHPDVRSHHFDFGQVRDWCVDLINIVAGQATLASRLEFAKEDGITAPSLLLRQTHCRAEPRLSERLLQLAIFTRALEDFFVETVDGNAVQSAFAAIDAARRVAEVDENDIGLREACNKLIHAVDVRPVYRRIYDEAGGDVISWALTGEVELQGARGVKVWQARLAVEPFAEGVLDRLAAIDELMPPLTLDDAAGD